jgi:predicted AAA+ superfamily ATPase
MKNNYFNRQIDNDLKTWSKDPRRKPLLLRGARQVGKSSSVKKLAENFEHFIEVNFETDEEVCHYFDGNFHPQKICEKISLHYDVPIVPEKTLLFFDEIQACPRAISCLRYFYENYQELHVIAAGSLLEFAFENLPSFGVGRIRSMFMHPFSFAEFITACGKANLWKAACRATPHDPWDEPFHNMLVDYLRRFLVIGGMPAAVAAFVETQDLRECQNVLDDLISSLKNDFAKYRQRIPASIVAAVFDMVIEQVGKKFVFSKTGQDYSHYQLKQALETLQMAGLVIPVIHSAASGIPLGALINPQKQKMLLLDTGIMQRLLGLDLADIMLSPDFDVVNKGNIAELFVGLELLKSAPCTEQRRLFYWQREQRNSHAEVDYVMQQHDKIIPIEVKAGRQGAMQSLRLFMKEKQSEFGVRTSLENFAQYDNIKVCPLYAIGNVLKK